MLFHHDIKGADLPPKTVCLTYDDGPGETEGNGPGPHTTELGHYLFQQGIRAAFFVIGQHAEQHRATLRRLHDWGHLIGNHTYSHPGLVALAEAGGDVVGELERTDELIRDYVSNEEVLFRAPYGNWRQASRGLSGPGCLRTAPGCLRTSARQADAPYSIVANILTASGRFDDYLGPVNWDITAEDWEFWRRRLSAEECALGYLREIHRVGHGIVLMHDSSEDPDLRCRNRTMQATKLLVPVLKTMSYRFVGLDEVVSHGITACANS
jgi:peptidoglycan/xylan/chitin deacetylase (PgdA/CDA1 family)